MQSWQRNWGFERLRRKLLNLLFVQDLTQVQAARILGVTRQSISKAKEKLLRRLRMKNGFTCPE